MIITITVIIVAICLAMIIIIVVHGAVRQGELLRQHLLQHPGRARGAAPDNLL